MPRTCPRCHAPLEATLEYWVSIGDVLSDDATEVDLGDHGGHDAARVYCPNDCDLDTARDRGVHSVGDGVDGGLFGALEALHALNDSAPGTRWPDRHERP